MQHELSFPVVDDVEIVDLTLRISSFMTGTNDPDPLAEIFDQVNGKRGDPVVRHLLAAAEDWRGDWLCGRRGQRERPSGRAWGGAAREYDRLAADLVARFPIAVKASRERHLDLIDWALIRAAELEPARIAGAESKGIPRRTFRYDIRGVDGREHPQKDVVAVCTPTRWREVGERGAAAGPRLLEIRRRARAAADQREVAGWAGAALEELLFVVRATRARQPEVFAFLGDVLDAYGG